MDGPRGASGSLGRKGPAAAATTSDAKKTNSTGAATDSSLATAEVARAVQGKLAADALAAVKLRRGDAAPLAKAEAAVPAASARTTAPMSEPAPGSMAKPAGRPDAASVSHAAAAGSTTRPSTEPDSKADHRASLAPASSAQAADGPSLLIAQIRAKNSASIAAFKTAKATGDLRKSHESLRRIANNTTELILKERTTRGLINVLRGHLPAELTKAGAVAAEGVAEPAKSVAAVKKLTEPKLAKNITPAARDVLRSVREEASALWLGAFEGEPELRAGVRTFTSQVDASVYCEAVLPAGTGEYMAAAAVREAFLNPGSPTQQEQVTKFVALLS